MSTLLRLISFSCLSLFLFVSCKQEQKSIEFVKITDVDLGNLSKNNATIRGIAVFQNHSKNECSIEEMILDFTIDGKSVGTIVSKSNRKINANTEFSVPFEYKYDTEKIVEPGTEPAKIYAVELLGKLNLKNADNLESIDVKYAESYEYKTAKEERIEKREERKESRKEKREQRKQERQNK